MVDAPIASPLYLEGDETGSILDLGASEGVEE